jgi:hypothetical protein
LEAQLSSDIDSLADVDNATISLNTATNTIRLKETIAAPDSGMYTFDSSVYVNNEFYVNNRIYVEGVEASDTLTVGGVDVMAEISSEISARIAGDESLEVALSTEVSYLLANTDLTSIDSFAEISTELSALTDDFDGIYFKKASFSGAINGTNDEFTLNDPVRANSEAVYLNGILLEVVNDYTLDGSVVIFTSAPQTGDKVVIYGVYGGGGTTTTTTTLAPIPLPQYEFVSAMGMPVSSGLYGFESAVNNLVGGNVVTTLDMDIQELVSTWANNEVFSLVARDANNTVVHQELLLDKTTLIPTANGNHYATGPNVTATYSPENLGFVYEFTPTSFILSSYPLAIGEFGFGEYKLELTTNSDQTSVDSYLRLTVF